jgi:hypothetical protein
MGFAATKYDEQRSRSQTQDGKAQLLKDATKVMLVLPTDPEEVRLLEQLCSCQRWNAIGSFLIVQFPETLRITNRAILLPLNTLDNIRAIGRQHTPSLLARIGSMKRGEGDRSSHQY